MRSNHLIAAALLALASSACATTQLTSVWRAPLVSQVTFHNVLAVAMVRDEGRRRSVEDRMVADIHKQGANAVPSYLLISDADTRRAEVVKQAVLAGGFDGAVTWRTIGVNTVTRRLPDTGDPLYPGFWGYYDVGWASAYDPGYLQTDRVVRVETMVYSLVDGSDRLIWVGTSETIDPNSIDDVVDGVADATIAAMRSEGLLAQRR